MEFGDVFTIRLLTARPVVVVAAPESVGELLEADPASAHAGEARRSVLPFASPCSVFGGGARRCVGEHLAQAEIATVIPAFLHAARPVPLAAEPELMVQRATVLVPRRGLLARVA